MSTAQKHTEGPWLLVTHPDNDCKAVAILGADRYDDDYASGFITVWSGKEADALLIASAPDLLNALRNVNKLIAEAAMTGFNCKDGDWAERLFESQQVTSAAIRRAVPDEYRSPAVKNDPTEASNG